jgi:hypothetical protein
VLEAATGMPVTDGTITPADARSACELFTRIDAVLVTIVRDVGVFQRQRPND